MRTNANHVSLGLYLLLGLVILPLLSPLRAMGMMDPAYLRNFLTPPILLLMIIAAGPARVFFPRSIMQWVMGFVFVQATVVGLLNNFDPDNLRNYLSHLFQLVSAYIMFGIGWASIGSLGHKFWKYFAIMALISVLVSTAITLNSLGRGDLGRLYTPAYTFIFIVAFSAIYSRKITILSVLGLVVSNKRGPIISVALMIFQNTMMSFLKSGHHDRRRLFRKTLYGLVILAATIGVLVSLIHWSSKPENASSPVAMATQITIDRFADIITPKNRQSTLRKISEERVRETEAAYDSLDMVDVVIGSGAGWSVSTGFGKSVHYLHFTPLSITAVYGAPFMVFLYGYVAILVINGSLRKDRQGRLSTAEKMAPLYLSGAFVHSLVAYSLFVDLMVFYFIGLLSKSLKTKYRQTLG